MPEWAGTAREWIKVGYHVVECDHGGGFLVMLQCVGCRRLYIDLEIPETRWTIDRNAPRLCSRCAHNET